MTARSPNWSSRTDGSATAIPWKTRCASPLPPHSGLTLRPRAAGIARAAQLGAAREVLGGRREWLRHQPGRVHRAAQVGGAALPRLRVPVIPRRGLEQLLVEPAL